MKLFNKRILLLCVYITLGLFAKAVVYEPFASVDYSLPSDLTWGGRISNETHPFYESNQSNVGNWSVIGGGRVYFCPHCGAALDPGDHTELDKKQNGNAYEYTGRIHHCLLPLNGEYILLFFVFFLLLHRNLINKVSSDDKYMINNNL